MSTQHLAPAQPPPVAPARQAPPAALTVLSEYGIFIVTAVTIVVAAVAVNGFASTANVVDIFHRAAPVGIVAVGMTFVVISANYIDLSVVSQVAIAGVTLLSLGADNLPLGIVCGIALCVLVGLLNGLAVGVLRANAVVVTLATGGASLGVLSLVTSGTIYYGSSGGLVDRFGHTRLGPFPLVAVSLLVVAVIGWFLLSRTVFGFSLRSLGANRAAARLSGVRGGWTVTGAFVVSSLCCAAAGFVLASISSTAVATMSNGYDFSALAAVIVGGNSLFGGRGSVQRTLIGVIFVSVVANILVLLGLPFAWQQLVTGSIIVAAVALDSLSRKAGIR